jgi:hypothetical protein
VRPPSWFEGGKGSHLTMRAPLVSVPNPSAVNQMGRYTFVGMTVGFWNDGSPSTSRLPNRSLPSGSTRGPRLRAAVRATSLGPRVEHEDDE